MTYLMGDREPFLKVEIANCDYRLEETQDFTDHTVC